jgi:hypothetical protein
MKMTRRALALALPLAAGLPEKAQAQASAPSIGLDEMVASAHRRFQSSAQQLAAVKLARHIEPVCHFEA